MRGRTRRGLSVAVGMAVALTGMTLAPAGAEEKLDSFAGSCVFEGTVRFWPPATNDQQRLYTTYDASGTCSGTLNGRQVAGMPADMNNAVRDVDGSCRYANTTTPGRGSLRFADGTRIAYTFGFNYVATEGITTFEGERSGSARSHASFLTQRTSPEVSSQCAGSGVREIPMDLQLVTESPLVGKARGNEDNRRTEARPRGDRLKLRVRPRGVRAGKRTVFRFRVATVAGNSVPGAVIRFAGRRVQAGRTGRVRIAATPRRAGRRTARVTKRGYRGGRATIRVRGR